MRMKLMAAGVLAVGLGAGAFALPEITDRVLAALQKRAERFAPQATFTERFDAIKELDQKEMAALRQWIIAHGVIGHAPVVGKGCADEADCFDYSDTPRSQNQ